MDFHTYAKLSPDEIKNASVGDYLFLTWPKHHFDRAPSIVAKKTDTSLMLFTPAAQASQHDLFTEYKFNNKTATLERCTSMLIPTPDGLLRISDKLDEDYPGVIADLPEAPWDCTLTMVEYIPGGEGACDYMPHDPDRMATQAAELNTHRRTTGLSPKTKTPGYDSDEATPGFVTRAWENASDDWGDPKRIFHYGYKPES